MGISGLLPLLKPIQVRKHLSEYSGQTIAVDAYVWLHRGTYACATELANGRKTNKYVDYAMHRVRLLRHHNITPYIVFDGGPLPAKKRTESDRKKRREENLARANALAAQGKHSQAREFYVKCVDVTPQMAYQLIKALRAESVPYIVAPYEADAQMAYLEQQGVVDGILTEDSDLLVFGCKNVLLKLDPVESTVTAISRADFASLDGTISLLGWSDMQFRAMAILSGCDYLSSIPGIGLKTAWTLLRKHKTVENLIRSLKVEGKKQVPKGYLDSFRLAEKVFLHQRVYDSEQKRLVNLTPIPEDEEWDDEKEAHVGSDIEPCLARKIAEGDACPITMLPMEDINPSFAPRALKPLPVNSMGSIRTDPKGKGKMAASDGSKSGGLLNFFTPNLKAEGRHRRSSQPTGTGVNPIAKANDISAGRASGKRTLSELVDQDMNAKRKKRNEHKRSCSPVQQTPSHTSMFFRTDSSRPRGRHVSCDSVEADRIVGPSRSHSPKKNKENIPCLEDSDIEEVVFDPVTQEDGYMTPPPTCPRWDSPELSSPARPGRPTAKSVIDVDEDEDDFGADILSSPPCAARNAQAMCRAQSDRQGHDAGRVLVHGTPTAPNRQWSTEEKGAPGPDLRDIFEDWNDLTSDIDESCEESMEDDACWTEPMAPTSLWRRAGKSMDDIYDEFTPDEEEIEKEAATARQAKVANGWWDRWGCATGRTAVKEHGLKLGSLKRRETTITPEGRHRCVSREISTKRDTRHQDLRSETRRSLVFSREVNATLSHGVGGPVSDKSLEG